MQRNAGHALPRSQAAQGIQRAIDFAAPRHAACDRDDRAADRVDIGRAVGIVERDDWQVESLGARFSLVPR
jgi:hypothetical protein